MIESGKSNRENHISYSISGIKVIFIGLLRKWTDCPIEGSTRAGLLKLKLKIKYTQNDFPVFDYHRILLIIVIK